MAAVIHTVAVGPMGNLAYIFGCDVRHEAAVIDPSAEVDKILRELARLKLKVTAVINTHDHVDHVAGNAALLRATGAPLICHAEAHPERLDPFSRQFLTMLHGEPSPKATRTVVDGERIAVGEQTLEVMHVPGHTRGDMALLAPGAVFTGDVLFVEGVGRTDLPGSDHAQLMTSLRTRLATLPDATVIYPGHHYGSTPTSTIGREKSDNPYLKQALDMGI